MLDLILDKINIVFLKYKDILLERDNFKITYFRKNLVTKIISEKDYNKEAFTFLFAISYFNNIKLLEIVKAGLQSINKKVIIKDLLDEDYVDSLTYFIKYHDKISIELENNTIFLKSSDEKLEVLSMETDLPAKQLFIRSLACFLAICGKRVSSNIDNIILNDYGCVNTDLNAPYFKEV